jgi:hypothetical protein
MIDSTRTFNAAARIAGYHGELRRPGTARPQIPRLYAARALAATVMQRYGSWSLPGVARAMNYNSHSAVHDLIAKLEAGGFDRLMPDGQTGVETAYRLACELGTIQVPPRIEGQQAAEFLRSLAS